MKTIPQPRSWLFLPDLQTRGLVWHVVLVGVMVILSTKGMGQSLANEQRQMYSGYISEPRDVNGDGSVIERDYVIDWLCGVKRLPRYNFVAQDEYCEWDQNYRKKDSGYLLCNFRANFHPDRAFWIPSRFGLEKKWDHTEFNSLEALENLVIDCSVKGAHCYDKATLAKVNRNRKQNGLDPLTKMAECDETRMSDPAVCEDLQGFLHDRSQSNDDQNLVTSVKPMTFVNPEDPRSKPIAHIKIGWTRDLPEGCKYAVDPALPSMTDPVKMANYVRCEYLNDSPYKSCDEIAKEISVGVPVTRVWTKKSH